MVPPASTADANNESWQAIERLVEELASLAQTDLDPRAFYESLLDRAVRALAAVGGGVWRVEPAHSASLLVGISIPPEFVDGSAAASHQTLVGAAWKQSVPRVVPERLSNADGGFENPSPWLLILCPVQYDGQTAVVVEIILEPTVSPDAQAGAARLLTVFCELAADYHRRRELQQLRLRNASFEQFNRLVEGIHASLDPLETAYCIANDGRNWIGCDRVSVAELRGRSARILAVSGVDRVDQRSEEVQRLGRLAAVAATMREPLYWSGDVDHLPPQVAEALDAYVDHAHTRQLFIVPLSDAPEQGSHAAGMLIVESFDERIDNERLRRRVEDVARHGAAALAKSIQHHRIPLLGLFVAMGRILALLRRRLFAVLLLSVAVAVVVALLVMVPVEFTVEAQGTLQPEHRRNVFAPTDGIVRQVLVDHGDRVTRDDELLQLSDHQLDFERARVAGELQTAQTRLVAVRAKRASGSTPGDPRQGDRELASEEERLEQQVTGLLRQQELLDDLHGALRLTSPLTGRIETWNVRELLQDRPVRQGQLLLSVADQEGPWILELQVADNDVGHVLSAQEQDQTELRVSYLLATDPSVTYQGRIDQVSKVTESNDGEPPSAPVTVQLVDATPTDLRTGAGVIARIHCGTRPVGYVWLHDLIDAVRSRVLF